MACPASPDRKSPGGPGALRRRPEEPALFGKRGPETWASHEDEVVRRQSHGRAMPGQSLTPQGSLAQEIEVATEFGLEHLIPVEARIAALGPGRGCPCRPPRLERRLVDEQVDPA